MLVLVGIAVMALGELFVRYYLQKLANRLNRILDGMTKVMDGDLAVRIPIDSLLDEERLPAGHAFRCALGYKKEDELDVIARYFNEMCAKLDEHIKKQYLAEIEQKNAEMDALQSQINPHFLYNTFECICSMALYYEVEDIAEITMALSKVFRFAVKGENLVSVEEEVSYIREYAKIIDYRFMGKIDVNIEMDDSVREKRVIKLMLQPLVENALLHGLEEKGLVTAYEGEAAAGKPRRYYHLTKQGRGALREKETAWNDYARAVGRVLRGGACLA